MSKLSEKAKLFCNEFMVDLNASKAAIRAGYGKKNARNTSSLLLDRPDVISYLAELKAAAAERCEITQDRVLNELKKIAFWDVRKLYDSRGNPIPIHLLDADTAGAIAGVDIEESGNKEITIKTKKIKVSEKRAALEAICNILGFNAPEKHHHEIEDKRIGYGEEV
jgi:phage terminase small subunit